MEHVICVRHRDGWCATKRKVSLRYAESVPTLCGMHVTAPFGFEWRYPDCPECRAIFCGNERPGKAASDGQVLHN